MKYGIIITTDPAMPLNFGLCTNRRAFLFIRGNVNMKTYPKNVLSTVGLLQKLIQKGMIITDFTTAERTLNEIGFYRFRGYCFHLYIPAIQRYKTGTTFETVLNIYKFDSELRNLLFDMSCQIEIALRARLCEAMLQYNDPLVYFDPSIFKEKEKFWRNTSTLASEIARSNDVFITHHYNNHDGQIPLWAAVEVMSFGTLSKYIKNLTSKPNSPFSKLASYYSYKTTKGNTTYPSHDMFTSWIHSVVVLRNICAHNSRIYNRSLSTKPTLIKKDQQNPQPRFYGLYHFLLAMKYLRPSDTSWNEFMTKFKKLLYQYQPNIDFQKIYFPADWQSHL